MASTVTFLAAISVGFARAAVHNVARVSPDLEPESDKKFFGKDYPWDKRPVADKHYVFDHPYPAVQDTGDYDRDFVKDENADGGKWKAQMEYDTLRSKIRKAEKSLAQAKTKLDKEESEWRSAKDRTLCLPRDREYHGAARHRGDAEGLLDRDGV